MVECSKCNKPISQSQCTYQKNEYHNECCSICSPPDLKKVTLKEKSPPLPPPPKKPPPPEKNRAGPGKLNFAILGNFELIPEVNCETCKKPITGKRFLSKKANQFNCQDCYIKVADNKCFMCKKLFEIDEECFKDEQGNNHCAKCIKVYLANRKVELAKEAAQKPSPAKPQPPPEVKPNVIHCDVCTKPISTSILQFNGFNYHDKCFMCCKCKAQLTSMHFYKEPDGLYCEKCKPLQACSSCKRTFNTGESLYEVEQDGCKHYCNDCYYKMFSKACNCCHKPIDSGQTYLHFLENNYHMNCFTCCQCKQQVGQENTYFYKNEKDSRFCEKCVKEYMVKNHNSTITTWTAIISIKTSSLLSCEQCKKAFAGGESFYRGDKDKPFCVECYTKLKSKPCHGCSKQIGPSEQKLLLDEQYYHPECLKCAKCKKIMKPTEDFYQIGKHQYSCHDCINK